MALNMTAVVPLEKTPIPSRPMEFLSADVFCPLPRSKTRDSVILMVCCHFIKLLFGVALPDQKAEKVGRALGEKVFQVHRVNFSLLTDI